MKKFLLIICIMVITLSFMLSSCCNHTSTAVVPNHVLDDFYDKYPTADRVNWKMQNNTFEVDFVINDQDMKASYAPYRD